MAGLIERNELPSEITVKNLMNLWLEQLHGTLRESSFATYYWAVNKHILPSLGEMQLSELNKEVLHQFQNELLEQKGLSAKSAWDIMTKLDAALHLAVDLGYMEHADFCPNVKYQSKQKPETLNDVERRKLENYLLSGESPVKAGLLLCLKTGIAAGELCALKWEDIHLDSRIVIINKRLQRIVDTNSSVEKKAKTKIVLLPVEERKVPIPRDVVEYLKALPNVGSYYFLTDKADKFMELRSLQNQLKKCLEACGLERTINFYTLRATFIRTSLETGADIYAVSKVVGAKQVGHIGDRYGAFIDAVWKASILNRT